MAHDLREELLLIGRAVRKILERRLNRMNLIRNARDGGDDRRNLLLIVAEHGDKVILERPHMRLPIDHAAEEEGVAVGVDAREVINVVIAETHARRHMIEEERRQRLVDMQARDFAEARKACDRHIAELVNVPRLRRIAEAAQDAVVQNTAERCRLAALEISETLGERVGKRAALHQMKPLARHDVAVEIQAASCMVERTDRADEEVFVDIGSERVLLHCRIKIGGRMHAKRAFQSLQRRQCLARRKLQRLDGAKRRRGLVDDEGRIRLFDRLRLEDAVAVAAPETHECDDGMIFKARFAVVDAGAPMRIGGRRAADIGARELARLVERLHEERLRARKSIDVDERKRVVETDAKRRRMPLKLALDRLETRLKAHVDAIRLQVLRVKRNAHREDALDHAARISLQKHACASFAGFLVERRTALRTTKLARVRHEHDAHLLAERLLHGSADVRQVEIGRDKAEDERHAIGQRGDGREVFPRDLASMQVADGDISALQVSACRRSVLRGRLLNLRQGLRIHAVAQRRFPFLIFSALQKIKHLRTS